MFRLFSLRNNTNSCYFIIVIFLLTIPLSVLMLMLYVPDLRFEISIVVVLLFSCIIFVPFIENMVIDSIIVFESMFKTC